MLGSTRCWVRISDIGTSPRWRPSSKESYELVEHGIISEKELRDFTFTNPVGFLAGMNPDFFKGTAVEKEVANLMAGN